MTGVERAVLNSAIPKETYCMCHVIFSVIDIPKGVACTSLLDDEEEAIIYGCPYDYRYGLNLVKNDISYRALLSKEDLELGKRFCAISKEDAHEIGVDIPNWDGNGKWRNLITVDTSAHMRALYDSLKMYGV